MKSTKTAKFIVLEKFPLYGTYYQEFIIKERRVSGSTIKYDHSDSVIAYYTRWYAVHSVPTSYLRYLYIT